MVYLSGSPTDSAFLKVLDQAATDWPGLPEFKYQVPAPSKVMVKLSRDLNGLDHQFIASSDTLGLTISYINDCLIKGRYCPVYLDYFTLISAPSSAIVHLHLEQICYVDEW